MRQLDAILGNNLVGACPLPSAPTHFKENLKEVYSKVYIYMKRISGTNQSPLYFKETWVHPEYCL